MLPQRHRLTGAQDFTTTVRSGGRKGSATLVGHLCGPDASSEAVPDGPARVGFVVSRAVGNAVVRNRTKRRLRHLVADRLIDLPAGSTLVVRALPAAADADSSQLGSDLDRVLRRLAPPETAGAGAGS